MMAVQEASELIGARAPTQQEQELIYRWMKGYFSTGIKIQKILFFPILIIGLLLLLSAFAEVWSKAQIFYIIIGAGLIILALFFIRDIKKTNDRLRVFQAGKYTVYEGKVRDMGILLDRVGVMKVSFEANSGQVLDNSFEARIDELDIGTPLLLVHVKKEDYDDTRDYDRVFTPFMLTEQGIKLNL